jgi:hypothetical protein
MTIADDVKTTLVAVGAINTALTGGIHTYEETGRLGLNRDTVGAAFDTTTGLIKPCCVIKERAQVGDGIIRDIAVASHRRVVEIWLYNDGDETYDTLITVRGLVLTALDLQMIGSSNRILRWFANPLKDKDPALDNALVLRSDYAEHGLI